MKKSIGLMAVLAFAPAHIFAQDEAATEAAEKKEEKWDVSAPPLPTRDVTIDVREGTWMSLDVSPDGRTIAFDLLGDIYTMPIAGGEATNIASGMAWEMQPRFSPDGSKIAFTSDRGGGDNIWIMNADGSDKRQVTKEKFRLLNNATWSPLARRRRNLALSHFRRRRRAAREAAERNPPERTRRANLFR